MPIKVAIVDDDEGIRTSLATLIRRAPALRLVGDYADAETALKEIPHRPPDVVLMDINLPGVNGVECVRQLKSRLPAVQFLMLTVYEDSDSLFNSLQGRRERLPAQTHRLRPAAGGHPRRAWRRFTHDPPTGPARRPVLLQAGRRRLRRLSRLTAGGEGLPGSTRQGLRLQGNRRPDEASALTPCAATCGRFMRSCMSIPGPKRW